MSRVSLTITQDGVAVIKLDEPESKVNLLGLAMMQELDAAVSEVGKIPHAKAMILMSGKKDCFVAGADVKEIRALQQESPIQLYQASQLGKTIFDKIAHLSLPTVALINGTCLGGGTELTLACQYRIAADNKSTKIGLPEVNLGLIPGWGGCVRLPRIVGLAAALNLILNSKILDAHKALKIGLVDEICDSDQMYTRALELIANGPAEKPKTPFLKRVQNWFLEATPAGRALVEKQSKQLIFKHTKGRYPAPLEALKVIMRSFSVRLDKAMELESLAFAQLANSDVCKNLMNIFFAQQESKKNLPDVVAHEVDTIGVLGAGTMGAGIAQAALYAGKKVYLFDIEDNALDRGVTAIKKLFDGLIEKKKLTTEQVNERLNLLTTTTDYACLKDCDLVIEAIVENMTAKQTALMRLETTIRKDFIFATNTSSLSVDAIASIAKKPQNVVGLHFFNPVYKMPLVEVVKAEQTADETVATAKALAMQLNKTTVITKDAPGFVVNRIVAPYLREAAVLFEEGVSIYEIEKTMRDFGMPMGPFALMDEIGLDICAKVTRVMHEALGDRLEPPKLLEAMESMDVSGRKNRKGFYLYDEQGNPQGFNPDVQALISAAPKPLVKEAIQDRLVLLMINEASLCLQEGIIVDPAQLDLAMVMGTGFPPYRGGILRYADTIGTPIVVSKLEYLTSICGERYIPSALLKHMANAREDFYV